MLRVVVGAFKKSEYTVGIESNILIEVGGEDDVA